MESITGMLLHHMDFCGTPVETKYSLTVSIVDSVVLSVKLLLYSEMSKS